MKSVLIFFTDGSNAIETISNEDDIQIIVDRDYDLKIEHYLVL